MVFLRAALRGVSLRWSADPADFIDGTWGGFGAGGRVKIAVESSEDASV